MLKNPKFDYKKLSQLYDYDKNIFGYIKIKKDLASLQVLLHRYDWKNEDVYHMKNYAIIRIVTNIETFVKNLVIHLIDKFERPYEKLFKESVIELPLTKIEKIISEEITIGKIIATSFNFQNLNDINFVLSTLCEIQFLEKIKTYKIIEENNFIRNWDNFFKIFKLRHNIVHTISIGMDYSIEDLDKLGRATAIFTLITILAVFENMYNKEPNSLHQKDEFLFDFIQEIYQNNS